MTLEQFNTIMQTILGDEPLHEYHHNIWEIPVTYDHTQGDNITRVHVFHAQSTPTGITITHTVNAGDLTTFKPQSTPDLEHWLWSTLAQGSTAI
jgi:hypothetical protein